MKKSTLILAIMFLSIGMFATNDIEVSLCDNKISKTKVINREALSRCNELTLNSQDWKIKSFSLGYLGEGNYIESILSENTISEKVATSLKKYSPSKIYIEKIVIVNRKGEEKRLEAISLKISD
tara:strand:- start:153 stop:524 length:372 start_codon:yes stop_codon:yes gene_type:complete